MLYKKLNQAAFRCKVPAMWNQTRDWSPRESVVGTAR